MSYSADSRRRDRIERGIFYAFMVALFTIFLLAKPVCHSFLINKQVSNAHANHEEQNIEWPKSWMVKFHDDPGIFLNLVIALATSVLAVYTVHLVNGADNTAKRQLRAYVGADKFNFELGNLEALDYTPVPRNTPKTIFHDFIVIHVKNFGQTPAFNVRVFAYCAVTANPGERLEEDFFKKNDRDVLDTSVVRISTSNFTLHPGRTEIVKSVIEDISNIKEARKFGKNVYLFGRIYYTDIKAGHIVAVNFPKDWLARYFSGGFEPMRQYMFMAKGAFTWSDLVSARRLNAARASMFAQGPATALYNGVGIPLRGPIGSCGGVTIAASTDGPELTRDKLAFVQLLSCQFYIRFLDLEHKPANNDEIRLTEQEREVLTWYSLGKTQSEIAIILNVTPHVVKFHLKGIFRKLGVHNDRVAVLKASAMGLLVPTDC